MKELCQIPHFATLDDFSLKKIPEAFNLESFSKKQCSDIELGFCDSISEAYKVQLESVVDEVIAAENREYKVPRIAFPGRDEEKWHILYDLHYNRKK
uniref:Uncharacterized protein n=1 Tax=Panagrolaimus sp. ES5 TaxID=591445 RepID=A0AC34G6E1_9BILA